jgi:hypothetical protein
MKTHKHNQLSDEMLTITGEIPSWVVRAGAGIFSGIFGLILLGTWVIKYPEVLKGTAIVTTKVPPIRVVTHSSGRMIRLLAKDEMWVKKGQILAETENTTRLVDWRSKRVFTESPTPNHFPQYRFCLGRFAGRF